MGIADTAEKVIDAVVNISSSQTVDAARGGGGGSGATLMPQLPPRLRTFEEFFEEFLARTKAAAARASRNCGPQTARRAVCVVARFLVHHRRRPAS